MPGRLWRLGFWRGGFWGCFPGWIHAAWACFAALPLLGVAWQSALWPGPLIGNRGYLRNPSLFWRLFWSGLGPPSPSKSKPALAIGLKRRGRAQRRCLPRLGRPPCWNSRFSARLHFPMDGLLLLGFRPHVAKPRIDWCFVRSIVTRRMMPKRPPGRQRWSVRICLPAPGSCLGPRPWAWTMLVLCCAWPFGGACVPTALSRRRLEPGNTAYGLSSRFCEGITDACSPWVLLFSGRLSLRIPPQCPLEPLSCGRGRGMGFPRVGLAVFGCNARFRYA